MILDKTSVFCNVNTKNVITRRTTRGLFKFLAVVSATYVVCPSSLWNKTYLPVKQTSH
jgi:hypothetical protein